MAGPRQLNRTRPYETLADFLDQEGWTIERRTLLLLDAPELAKGELVRLSLSLSTGQRFLRTEGEVLGFFDPGRGRPAGTRIKFKRFDRSTKELIERILADREASDENASPMSIVADIPASIVQQPPAPARDRSRSQRPARSVPPSRRSLPPPVAKARERSMGHTVHTPADRDELLERLRRRAQRNTR